MHKNLKKRRPELKTESIFETDARLKKEARIISKNFVHFKPVKYLLKNNYGTTQHNLHSQDAER